jgi:N-acetylmuramoyl-L-alanine amidase
MKIVILALALLCLGQSTKAQKQKRGPLYGLVAVVDPGHGGTDPGSFRMFRGERVVENEYVYDVSVRVARIIREKSGLAILTVLPKS